MMQSKSFGKQPVETRDYTKEIYDLIGVEFPLTTTVNKGGLVYVEYKTEWQEGTTKQVKVGRRKKGVQAEEYKADYKDRKLTKAQIEKLENWIKDNLVS